MQKSIRLLKIWKLCRAQRYMTAARLAQECQVSERTIYRDVIDLGEMGVAITWDNGYRVIAENTLPQLNLTHSEQLVLALALQNLPLHLDQELASVAKGLIQKLLDKPVESGGIALESPPVRRLKTGVFSRLQNAIEEHLLVTLLNYRTLEDQRGDRYHLEPQLLLFRERAWYLIAWNPLRQRFSFYRLDRIGKLCIEKKTFKPRRFDVEDYLRGTFGAVVGEPQRLRVRFTGLAKEIVKKDGRLSAQEMREENNALILDKTIKGEILWLRWILGFGGEAEILEPLAMRKKAAQMMREGLEKNKGVKSEV